MWSAWLRSSTSSRFARSSAEGASASLTIRSTSSLPSLAVAHARLDRRAARDALVRVDSLVGLLAAEQVLDQLLDHRQTGRTTDEDDLVDLLWSQVGVLQRGQERSTTALGQVGRQRLELRPRERHLEVLRARLVGGDEGQVDARLQPARQLDLRPLRRLGEALQSLAVGLQVDAVRLLELVGQPVHDPPVVVVATKVGVAVGGLDLEHAVAHVEDGHVEPSTP